jgi:hypothetical protein
LKNFHSIFTLSYDLLLYWVIVHDATKEFSDGFGLGQEVDGFRTMGEGASCNTRYLHGALHLFLGPHREIRKRIVTNTTIVSDITDTIRRTRQLPLFVAEGSSGQKLARINSVPYLHDCYEVLHHLSGAIFIFGHSAREEDRHIYDAIFARRVETVFFCVHRPEEDWPGIRERLAPFCERNKKIKVSYVDAATANVWRAA